MQNLISPGKRRALTEVLDTEVTHEQGNLIMEKSARFTTRVLENYGTIRQHKLEKE